MTRRPSTRTTHRWAPLVAALCLVACSTGGDDGTTGATDRDSSAPTTPVDPTSGCATPDPDGCLYTSPEVHQVGVLTDEVRDDRYDRDIPVTVRFPLDPDGPAPVVVWSHGGPAKPAFPGARLAPEWGDVLARAGYVVVAPAHMITPDQREAACEIVGNPCEAMQLYRPADIAAVVGALPDLVAAHPELASADLDHLAMAGHSFGAWTTMRAAGAIADIGSELEEDRVDDLGFDAFLALSPPGPGALGFDDASFAGVDAPTMIETGAGDYSADEDPAGRSKVFDGLPPGDKARVWVDSPDATHPTFNLRNDDRPDLVAVVEAAGLAFLDAHLRSSAEAAAWLDSGLLAGATGGTARLDVK